MMNFSSYLKGLLNKGNFTVCSDYEAFNQDLKQFEYINCNNHYNIINDNKYKCLRKNNSNDQYKDDICSTCGENYYPIYNYSYNNNLKN